VERIKKGIEEMHTLKVVDGRYSIKDRKLGEGSFAKTYLAIDTKSSKVIACKMIEKKNLIDKINLSKNKSLTKEYFINALKNEVKTWKAIHHENIVEFIDFSETQNNIYFFLEFCSGG
jgi:serine/threonine protein kinase